MKGLSPPALARRLLRTVERHRHFVSSVGLYGLSQGVMKGADVVSFSMLIYYLTPIQFGFIGIMSTSAVVVVDLIALGVPRVGIPRFSIDPVFGRAAALRGGYSFMLVYSILVLCGLPFLPHGFFEFIKFPGFETPFYIFVVSFLFRAVTYMHFEMLRLERRSLALAIAEPIPSLINLAAQLLLLTTLSNKMEAAAYAQLLPWAIPAVVFMVLNRKDVRLEFRRLPEVMRFSAPVTIQRVMDEVNKAGDRWVVLFALGVGYVGAYTFLSRLGDFMRIAVMPLQKAFIPQLYKHVIHDEPKEANGLARLASVWALMTFLGSLVVVGPIARLIDRHGTYAWTYEAIPIVVLGHFAFQAYVLLGLGFYIAKRPAGILPISIGSALINLIASYTIAKTAGLLYVPYATVLSYTFLAVGCYFAGRKYFSYSGSSVLLTMGACYAIGLAAFVGWIMLT